MIRVSFEYDPKGRIYFFRMEGHARSFRPWPDVICAGVSAIAQTTIGSLEELAGVSPRYTLESGWIRCEVDYPEDPKKAKIVATLMESTRIGCLQIEASYGSRYVTVEDNHPEDIKGEHHD